MKHWAGAAVLAVMMAGAAQADIKPGGQTTAKPEPSCIELPSLFGYGCVPQNPKGFVSRACEEERGSASIEACTKDIETAKGENRLWPLLTRALHYMKAKRFTEAVADLDAVLAIKPDLFLAWSVRSMCQIALGHADLARADLEHSVQLRPQNFTAHFALASLYAKAGENEKAAAEIRAAVDAPLANTEEYYQRADFLYNANMHAAAFVDLSTVLARNPNHVGALMLHGAILAERHQADQARADCAKVQSLEPATSAKPHHCYGLAAELAGEYATALDEFSKAVALEPNEATLLQNRGSVYLMLGRYDEAVSDFDRAIALRADHADYYTNRGIAHRHLGHLTQALADYSKAIELTPNNPVAYTNRGALYLAQKDFEHAQADFEKALQLDPRNANAMRGAAKARAKQDGPLGQSLETR